MILADKIIKLRKQLGWSQEELAEKMHVSRQSVSKWESANSIPDLNKIIKLANIFDVSIDSLLKDEIEVLEHFKDGTEQGVNKISLEHALRYIDAKIEMSALVTKGVILCICSVIPLFFFLAMAETNRLNLTGPVASAIGVVCMLIMVAIGVSFFIKTNHYENDIDTIENDVFELEYGVHSAIKEKLQTFRSTYNVRISIGIFMFIVSHLPLMFVSMFFNGPGMTLMMLIVLFLIIAAGIYIIVPVSAKYDAYNNILKESGFKTEKSLRTKRAEKLAAFYWPLLTAIYLGWSLWTMNWRETWIVLPVGAVLFAALVGLMELLNKEDH